MARSETLRIDEQGRLSYGPEPVRLAGEIRAAGWLADIVTLIGHAGWTGTLVVRDERALRTLAFDSSRIVAATSLDARERLTEVLFRLGFLTRQETDNVERCAALEHAPATEVAIAMGLLDPSDARVVARRSVEEIFFAALDMATGTFCFYDALDASAEAPQFNPPPSQALLIQYAHRADELRAMAERVPALESVPERLPTAKPTRDDLAPILALCNGRRSIADIGRHTSLLDYETMKAIDELVLSGHLRIDAPRPRGPRGLLEVVNRALLEMHARAGAASGALREALSRFVANDPSLARLLDGAGPALDGTLSIDRVTQNLLARHSNDPVGRLRKALDEYVAFGMFVAGGHLGATDASTLERNVSTLLGPLERVTHSMPPPSIAPRRARPDSSPAKGPADRPSPVPR